LDSLKIVSHEFPIFWMLQNHNLVKSGADGRLGRGLTDLGEKGP
jgi:hypothetical protein